MNIKVINFFLFLKRYFKIRDKEEKDKIYIAVISTFILLKLMEAIFANWENIKASLF